MTKSLLNLCSISLIAVLVAHDTTWAAQAPNPRSGAVVPTGTTTPVATTSSSPRDGRTVQRLSTTSGTNIPSATAQRSATSRTVVPSARTARQTITTFTSRPDTTTARTAASTVVRSTGAASSARSGVMVKSGGVASSRAASSHVVRSAASPSTGRGGTSTSNISRAASSRATAVFDDISKIGGGYAKCRESYNTCMDQFCAKANETYRRCFCSERFTEFRDTEAALDEAKILLTRFEDNNLNAVDKTAAEVNAMYTATVGEQAIKDDVSGAAALLGEIGDLLSGKKKAGSNSNTTSSPLDIGAMDFTVDMDDIWSGANNSGSDIFGNRNASDLSTLEGGELYKNAHDQCMKLIGDSCENNAVMTMARSSYSILISQDCNLYEKKIDAQKEAVNQTVRQANKYLMDARLEEYRAHNSADVNECLAKVKEAVQGEMVCGENYKKCLDPTGMYVNATTGAAIYSPMLFKLTEQINLYQSANSSQDLLTVNREFANFLDEKRKFATGALDTCRDMADTVWTEFKRAAVIEIAQAQNELIESVKSTCVSTMGDCYDSTSGQLKEFDTTTSQMSGAMAAYAARDMCKEKVVACAALYGDPSNPCQFDNNGKLTTPNCGMQSLLNFVQSVDNVKIQEGCAQALTNYMKDTCTPTTGQYKYPWGCRNKSSKNIQDELAAQAKLYCIDPTSGDTNDPLSDPTVGSTISKLVKTVGDELFTAQENVCEEVNGIWIKSEDWEPDQGYTIEAAYYKIAAGGTTPTDTEIKQYHDIAVAAANGQSTEGASNTITNAPYGFCFQNTVRYQCLAQDDDYGGKGYAKYDAATNTCSFTVEWYQGQCQKIGGYWENNICYIKPTDNTHTCSDAEFTTHCPGGTKETVTCTMNGTTATCACIETDKTFKSGTGCVAAS